jgi:hypothetical protein
MEAMMKTKQLTLLFLLCAAASASMQAQSLFDAARSNNLTEAKRLVEANADVNQQDDKGYTPLILATYNDNFEVAIFLLEHGAKTEVSDHSGRTALMGACFKGNEREVKLLLDHGANTAAKDTRGFTSMMYAVMFARLSVINELRSRQEPHIETDHASATK